MRAFGVELNGGDVHWRSAGSPPTDARTSDRLLRMWIDHVHKLEAEWAGITTAMSLGSTDRCCR